MHKYVYTCGVDYQEEIEQCKVEVYPTIEDLKNNRSCWPQCGIVRLRIEIDEWIEPQDFHKEIL